MGKLISFKTRGKLEEDKLPPLKFENCFSSGLEENMVRVFFNREPTEYEMEALSKILDSSDFGSDNNPFLDPNGSPKAVC